MLHLHPSALRPSNHSGHNKHVEKILIEATLIDDLLDPALKLGGGEEFLTELLAGFQVSVKLADPKAEAGQLPAPPQKGVVQVRDVVPVAPVTVQIFGAGGELPGDRFHLGVDRRSALTLGRAEPAQPVVEAASVG